MAGQQELKELIYKYYPKGMAIGDEYAASKEYRLRKQKIDDAIANADIQVGWANFKEEFQKLVKDKSRILADYSFFSGSPAHQISIRAEAFDGLGNNVIVFSVMISVIVNYWAYRFTDQMGTILQPRYSTQNTKEEELIAQVDRIIIDTFPDYQLLEEKYLMESYDHLETSVGLERSPTVFDLLFADHDN